MHFQKPGSADVCQCGDLHPKWVGCFEQATYQDFLEEAERDRERIEQENTRQDAPSPEWRA